MKLTESKLKEIIIETMERRERLENSIELLEQVQPVIESIPRLKRNLRWTGPGHSRLSNYSFEEAMESINKELGGEPTSNKHPRQWFSFRMSAFIYATSDAYIYLNPEDLEEEVINQIHLEFFIKRTGEVNFQMTGYYDLSRHTFINSMPSTFDPSRDLPLIQELYTVDPDEVFEFAKHIIDTHGMTTMINLGSL